MKAMPVERDPMDLPGGLKARQALMTLAGHPAPKRSWSKVYPYIEALYAEIRDCKMAGWPWNRIRSELQAIPGIPKFSEKVLIRHFRQVDGAWAKETGEEALKARKRGSRKTRRT